MKILFLFFLTMFFTKQTFCQIASGDTLIIKQAIYDFGVPKNESYFLLDKTFNLQFALNFCGNSVSGFNGIDSLRAKLPASTLKDFKAMTYEFKEKSIKSIGFSKIITDQAEELSRLRFSMTMETGTNENDINNMISSKIERLKEQHNANELKVYQISEPFYDKTLKYMIIGLALIEPHFQNDYVVLYKKINNKWVKQEIRKLCTQVI